MPWFAAGVSMLALAAADGAGILAHMSSDSQPLRPPVVSSSIPVGVDGGQPLALTPPQESAAARGAGIEPVALRGPQVAGIPATVLAAYQQAAASAQPGCHLGWAVLAGIGKVESNHARGGDVNADGTMLHPVYGPPLDGRNGTAVMQAGDGSWVRAEGPMQFLPQTWAKWGQGDPQNVFDAARAAGRYLCAGGRDLSSEDGVREAILSYNPDPGYYVVVRRWIELYQHGGTAVPDQAATVDGSGVAGGGAGSGGQPSRPPDNPGRPPDNPPPRRGPNPPPASPQPGPPPASPGKPGLPLPPVNQLVTSSAEAAQRPVVVVDSLTGQLLAPAAAVLGPPTP